MTDDLNNHRPAFPQLTRRDFFRVGGATVAGYSLLPMISPFNVYAKAKKEPRGSAEVCIFYFLQGGMSQLDTFDLKEGNWTPEDAEVRAVHPALKMPSGLYPRLCQRMNRLALVRSMEAWELLHERGQYYIQVGHAFSPARFKEMPHVGSIIAYEYERRRKGSDFLPPFVALNFGTNLVGPGVLPATYSPMVSDTKGAPPFVVSQEDREEFLIRRELLGRLDPSFQGPSERGRIFQDFTKFYEGAYRLLDTPGTSTVFRINEEDHKRYGETPSGDACVIARNLVKANAGTRFICIGQPGWDLHGNAWKKDDKGKPVAADSAQRKCCLEMDSALAALLDDLAAVRRGDGHTLLEKTFVVCMGEFGRTPGVLNPRTGRGHHRWAHTALFAGGGVTGGKIIGATDEIANRVVRSDWHIKRSIYPEDVLATIYSAMGIDWTKAIKETPSGRVFYYIDDASPVGYMAFDEINELFS